MGYEKSAHLYDIFDKKNSIDFYCHYALDVGEILDIGAGTGRIAIPLAEKCVNVFCIEPSFAMRRECVKKLTTNEELSRNITLIEGEAKSFDLKRTFPAAFMSGAFDHFLDDEERLSSLKNVNRHLISGGKLVFDVFLGLMANSPVSPAGEYKKGDKKYCRFVSSKVLPGNIKETILIFETYELGKLLKRIEEKSLVGIIDRQKLHYVLGETGFRVNKEFGDYSFKTYKEGDDLLIIEAIKEKGIC